MKDFMANAPAIILGALAGFIIVYIIGMGITVVKIAKHLGVK